MSNLTRSAVNVFAVVEDFREGSGDILSSLMPFFEPIMQEARGEIFDPEIFAKKVCEIYKWNFNSDIAEELVPRFENLGWLTADDDRRRNGPYTITIAAREMTAKEQEVFESFDEIASKFRKFAQNLSPLTSLDETIEHYKDILIEWLLYVDAYSEANLEIEVYAGKDDSGKIGQRVSIPNTTTLGDDERYLCARFVENAIKTNSEVAATLCKVASIGLLTEVVQDFNKPTGRIVKSDLILYLDAPIAMEFLGVSGEAALQNIEPIVDELQKIGVQVRVFSQSLAEISRNLVAVLNEKNRTGPTARALAQGSVLEPFVRSVAADPETALGAKGVMVTHRNLDQFPNETKFFDEGRYNDLFGALTFQQSTVAREHDATIAALIMRMRQGFGSRDIFNSRVLLLTRNGVFAQQTKRICTDLAAMNPNNIPPVIHRRVLATAIWLRTGLNGSSDQIPKRQLLASCERILALKPNLVNAVKKFSEELNSVKAEQLDLLLAQDRSAQMLMDKTLGVSKVVTSANISFLFEEMLEPYLAEERQSGVEKISAVETAERAKTEAQRAVAKQEKQAADEARSDLKKIEHEDLLAIRHLATEVGQKIVRNRKAKKILGLLVALGIMIPTLGVFELSPAIKFFSGAIGIWLAYLSVTGSSIIGTSTPKNFCIAKLESIARKKGMADKLSRLTTNWSNDRFEIEKSNESKKDLLE